MSSALKAQLQRTLQHWQRYGLAVARMDPLGGEPFRRPLPIFEMSSPQDLDQFAIGSDADMGGLSTVQLAIEKSNDSSKTYGIFRGKLKTELGPEASKILKSGGYAGFRTKVRKRLIGEDFWNTDHHEYLRLRVRNSGDEMKYFVNIQIDGPASTDIFQHRLWLGQPGDWEDVLIPFADFALTNKGQIVKSQFEMPRDAIRTIGISVLEKPGPFELGIQKVDCVSDIGLRLEQEEENSASQATKIESG
ncbi:complex I intermediate-associated protein 30-domain-containing protein [Phakopsora pachyrhizi]|uniref:Complex I intermediate-associated protein 30-domain-containing protein n=1 Tax=Phakopsora pachyrhizi TaxID=170000 RepID=A0AAV0AH55_PHAPC|nr:complex I intermediate-associated protein 30-domain-containing protein [Phakopsora pachyrhizi]CAH7666490.1 complex I intermediate-associated protein 30-domain-containing protein [Phakopsora pachyrhizi]